jgi:uncharacterized membrane protein YdjX (TVP38/TMEM64 family)
LETNEPVLENKPAPKSHDFWRNVAFLAVLGGAFALAYFFWPGFGSGIRYVINILSHGDLERLKWYLRSFGVWAPIISALIMIFQSVAAPLPAFVVTLTNGLLFGAFWGTLLSWSSSMAGAVLCFFITRWLGRPAAERFVSKKALKFIDGFFAHYGTNAILIARLMPFISFDAVSYAAGLTNMSFWAFFWSSAVGELPATIIYSWLGQQITTLQKFSFWGLLGVLALVAFAFAIKRAVDQRMASKLKREIEAESAPVQPS